MHKINFNDISARIIQFIPLLLISTSLNALPVKREVAAGRAEFQSPDAQTLTIKASDKTIINYQKFDIEKGEHVRFVQPSSRASVLNRITGENPSKIFGKLSANGRVFLVNPNGVYFGPNAIVNTGSFLASTLNIRDEDFLNDSFRFYVEPGSEKAAIVNEGTI